MSDPVAAGSSPRVYISYANDSPGHARSVQDFGTFLRVRAGVDAHVDVWYTDRRRDWVSWLVDQLRKSDFILAIASPEYKRVADGAAQTVDGRTRELEAAMIRDNVSRNLPEATRRVLPVVLPGGSKEDIPDCLLPGSTTYYSVPELTLGGVENLMRVFAGLPLYELPTLGPFVPPTPGIDPIIVTAASSPAAQGRNLAVGAEITVGEHRYLVDGEYWAEQPNRERSLVRRQARALRLGQPRGYVWLRQIEVRHMTPAAKAALVALDREHELMTNLAGKANGLPEPCGAVHDDALATLATRWPTSRTTGGPGDTLAPFVPRSGETIDPWRMSHVLRGIAGLCGALAALHRHGATHRNLTPAGMVRLDDGKLVLTDLGHAGAVSEPGEGPERYRAPEQGRRHRGRVGPWTDVYQVAAVAYHLMTGHPPNPVAPFPVRGLVPGFPPAAAEVVDAALSTEPARRPAMTRLSSALTAR